MKGKTIALVGVMIGLVALGYIGAQWEGPTTLGPEREPETFTVVFFNSDDAPVNVHIWDEVPGEPIFEAYNVEPGDTPETTLDQIYEGEQFFQVRVNFDFGGPDEDVPTDTYQVGENLTVESDTMFIEWTGEAVAVGWD